MKEGCWTLRLSLALVYSCVIFTFIHTLCGSCIISEDYPKRNCISCSGWGLFFRNLLILSSVSILEYFFSHLTFLVLWSLSIYFSWDSSIILEDLSFNHLFLSGPETTERKMLTTQALTHTWLFLCYFHIYIHTLCGPYMISEEYS